MRLNDHEEFDRHCMRIEIAELASQTGIFYRPIDGEIIDENQFESHEEFMRCVTYYLERTER